MEKSNYENTQLTSELQDFINQVSVALERTILLIESHQHSEQISKACYQPQ
jgi:hypothetical protein